MSAMRTGGDDAPVYAPWADTIHLALEYVREAEKELAEKPGYGAAVKLQICKRRYDEMRQLEVINGDLA